MSVATTDFVVSHNANGILTAFAFAFKIIAASDLRVYEETAAASGLFTLKTLTTHYTVIFDADAETGTVTFLVAPGNGKRVGITRVTPTTQGTNLDREGRSPAKTHEGMIDKATLLAQEALEKLGRTFLFRPFPADPDPVDVDPLTDRRALIAQDNGDGTWTIVPSDYDPDELINEATLATSTYDEGLIADRPAAPSTRMAYYATDTGEYAHYLPTAGRWFTLG